jgi:hypothetical protein
VWVRGWGEDQYVWDGQGLKDPCCFEFFRTTKSSRKVYFMREKLVTLKGGLGIF